MPSAAVGSKKPPSRSDNATNRPGVARTQRAELSRVSTKTETTAVALVAQYIEAVNRHDMPRALAHLHEDFVFREARRRIGMDLEAMRDLLAWDAVIHSQARPESFELDRNRVVGVFNETNDLYQGLGIAATRCRLTFRLEEGRIREQVIEHLPTEGPSFDEALQPFLDWAGQYDPAALDTLLPGGEIEFRPDLARRWMELIERWKRHRRE